MRATKSSGPLNPFYKLPSYFVSLPTTITTTRWEFTSM